MEKQIDLNTELEDDIKKVEEGFEKGHQIATDLWWSKILIKCIEISSFSGTECKYI